MPFIVKAMRWIKIRSSGYWDKVVKHSTGIINVCKSCIGAEQIFAIAKDDALLKFHRLPFMDSELVHKTKVFALSFEMKSCYTNICNPPRPLIPMTAEQPAKENISLKDMAVSHFFNTLQVSLVVHLQETFKRQLLAYKWMKGKLAHRKIKKTFKADSHIFKLRRDIL